MSKKTVVALSVVGLIVVVGALTTTLYTDYKNGREDVVVLEYIYHTLAAGYANGERVGDRIEYFTTCGKWEGKYQNAARTVPVIDGIQVKNSEGYSKMSVPPETVTLKPGVTFWKSTTRICDLRLRNLVTRLL
ncbi:MAG: hypothetical protein IPL87_02530 [Candidatus Moraniibacteriota bacterium]|nr:MAG: hypothetical protein IPL87_02530 [Candidatus Moranbacteria bacterium]